MSDLTGATLAVLGATGVYLLYTAVALGWRDLRLPAAARGRARRGLREQRDLAAASALSGVLGGTLAWALFGGTGAPVVGAALAGTAPLVGERSRVRRRRAQAAQSWPRLIEEIRLEATTLGRSIPQALFAVGDRAPDELRDAFAAARREWLLSTDFPRTLAVLKARLADATADTVCETLLVAHELGGSDLDRRLGALIEDRFADQQERRDAEARQAGARFARRFVLLVPLGMALAGLAIGSGRAAYGTPLGQALVAAGLVLVAGCWIWAGSLMRLPDEQRVFAGGER